VDLLANPAKPGIARGRQRCVALGIEEVRRYTEVELVGLQRKA